MWRVIGVLVAAFAACGCTGQSTSASSPAVTTSPRATTTTNTILLPEGTWTFGSGGAGFVEGEMHIQGGPPPRDGKVHDQPLPGVVEVHSASNDVILTHVRVGRTGRFNIDLPAGNYELVGRPNNTGIMSMRSNMFAINVGHTVKVDLPELAT